MAALAIYRLADGRCVLQRGELVHTVDGISFALLRRVLGLLFGRRPIAAQEALRAAGYSRADARALIGTIAGAYLEDDAAPGRLWTERQLERWLGRSAGVEVRAHFCPPSEDVSARARVLIGPSRWWLGPLAGACAECALLRFAEEALAPAGDIGEDLQNATQHTLLLGAATLGHLVAGARALAGSRRSGWICGELGQAGSHRQVVRHPACDVCGRKDLVPASRSPPLGCAVRALAATRAAEVATAALLRLGVFTVEQVETPRSATYRGLPLARLSWRRAYREGGEIVVQEATQVGSGSSTGQRLVSARVEAVERVLVGTRAPDLRARPLRAMRGHLDPAEWGLFSAAQYAAPGFPFAAIGPDDPLDWVRGYDFAARRWIWVPLDLVNGASGRYLPASSTGAAAHTSAARVVVQGLLEIIEREALQRLWYRGAAARVIAPRQLGGEAVEQFTWLQGQGWRLHLLHAQGRAGRHVVGVLGELVRPRKGLRRRGCLLTSAASGRLAGATTRALAELVTAVEVSLAFPAACRRGPPDLDNAWDVNDPRAIQQLYLHPAMRPALDFFLAGEALGEAPPDRRDTATALVAALVVEGLRPIYVDCTVPGCAPLRVGKMLLCGTLPHSFATGQLRLGGGQLPAPPTRVFAPPPPGYRPTRGETTPYPFPLG